MTDTKPLPIDEILRTKEFKSFVECAENFCLFIEKGTADAEKEFLIATQYHLLTLYNLGRNLPSVQLETDTEFDVKLDDKEMKAQLQLIANRVPFSYYWAVLNPVDLNNLAETGTGDLVDDLGDIYKDLKEALILHDKSEIGAMENAIFQFKFGYDNHWGEHCIEALYAIHHYLSQNR
ncbi:DUF5063 domain-containing protein [Segetibacter aerophilus]|uniref:DUF5063 domain-containing protein n=1 Tax=Segetibacter aerophilus TaxID=670293 RepID=A0A512B8I5_9BACT|nr:DUF5063 domain-containing protein [Segetibacter aerophilus]GEO08272.1 DUF5063 domain-containing protein [Segetibacter aerophilus]